MSDPQQRTAETLRAWDVAAGKYAETIDADVAALRAGVLDLSTPERDGERRLSARAVERFAPEGLGQIVTAVAAAGLGIERLVEYDSHFWPEFPHIPGAELARLPHSFLLAARAAAPDST